MGHHTRTDKYIMPDVALDVVWSAIAKAEARASSLPGVPRLCCFFTRPDRSRAARQLELQANVSGQAFTKSTQETFRTAGSPTNDLFLLRHISMRVP